jgi:hypothetical protein
MTALARTSSNFKRQTRPLVREGVPHQHTRNCLTVIKIWLQAPDGCFIPRQTGRLTIGRNIKTQVQTQSELVGQKASRSKNHFGSLTVNQSETVTASEWLERTTYEMVVSRQRSQHRYRRYCWDLSSGNA